MIKGIKIVFGTDACPLLPEGFRLLRRPGCMALAVRRRKWFLICLEPDRLVPLLRPKNRKRRKPHCIYGDFKAAIPF